MFGSKIVSLSSVRPAQCAGQHRGEYLSIFAQWSKIATELRDCCYRIFDKEDGVPFASVTYRGNHLHNEAEIEIATADLDDELRPIVRDALRQQLGALVVKRAAILDDPELARLKLQRPKLERREARAAAQLLHLVPNTRAELGAKIIFAMTRRAVKNGADALSEDDMRLLADLCQLEPALSCGALLAEIGERDEVVDHKRA